MQELPSVRFSAPVGTAWGISGKLSAYTRYVALHGVRMGPKGGRRVSLTLRWLPLQCADDSPESQRAIKAIAQVNEWEQSLLTSRVNESLIGTQESRTQELELAPEISQAFIAKVKEAREAEESKFQEFKVTCHSGSFWTHNNRTVLYHADWELLQTVMPGHPIFRAGGTYVVTFHAICRENDGLCSGACENCIFGALIAWCRRKNKKEDVMNRISGYKELLKNNQEPFYFARTETDVPIPKDALTAASHDPEKWGQSWDVIEGLLPLLEAWREDGGYGEWQGKRDGTPGNQGAAVQPVSREAGGTRELPVDLTAGDVDGISNTTPLEWAAGSLTPPKRRTRNKTVLEEDEKVHKAWLAVRVACATEDLMWHGTDTLNVTREDLQSLLWVDRQLTGNVVDMYMCYLSQEHEGVLSLSSYITHQAVYTEEAAEAHVKNFCERRKIDLKSIRSVLIPLHRRFTNPEHTDDHWMLASLQREDGQICLRVYDSYLEEGGGKLDERHASLLRRIAGLMTGDATGVVFEATPQQAGVADCGVYVLACADAIARSSVPLKAIEGDAIEAIKAKDGVQRLRTAFAKRIVGAYGYKDEAERLEKCRLRLLGTEEDGMLNDECVSMSLQANSPISREGVLILTNTFWAAYAEPEKSAKELRDRLNGVGEGEAVLLAPMHTGGNHWIALCMTVSAASDGRARGVAVEIYDSMQSGVQKAVEEKLMGVFGKLDQVSIPKFSYATGYAKQKNGIDCGVFAVKAILSKANKNSWPTKIEGHDVRKWRQGMWEGIRARWRTDKHTIAEGAENQAPLVFGPKVADPAGSILTAG